MPVQYTVRTNYGRGWSIPEAPECYAFGSQAEAQRYAELRNGGMGHLKAWEYVEAWQMEIKYGRPDGPIKKEQDHA